MITEEENNLLTRTGKGTPCGDLMRRYWQPCALSEELGADKPLPVTIFGEEMILFRDGAGKPALIGRYCAHQGVDMIYGRVEPDGLRCMYHGWLFDQCGKVLLRGEWLPEKERRWDVGQPFYPVTERGGVIYTFMGQGDAPPLAELPMQLAAQGAIERFEREQNYWQGIRAFNQDHARFLIPNLVRSEALTRWLVPVDDKAHVEFVFRHAESPQSMGASLRDASVVLLRAIRDNSTAPASPS